MILSILFYSFITPHFLINFESIIALECTPMSNDFIEFFYKMLKNYINKYYKRIIRNKN
ncbi:hypothetical protein BHWA1_00651 [Brachyspira hyodysenteriae WA1]|uniref:Uncharacterized protein n=1 Tax=Brachyspira hyodysenteriae (strain ATCC 49526 / WA1) TaxID=565034 RepID=A0A3B6VAI2_BRAHW|nr:hypothetical protein BHWA1_00651 [Brachyspira hyodysenteriae WA1]